MELKVERLKDEFAELLRGFQLWQQGVAALMLSSVGIGLYVARQQQETEKRIEHAQDNIVQALTDPATLAETIRKQIHATADDKIKMLPDVRGRWQKVAEIEKERDLALGRVDDLIKLIQDGLKEGASPVFQRATEILQKEGTDEALAYLESSRPSTLELARRHADQAKTAQARAEVEKVQRNKTLQALVLEAKLLETKLQWQAALELREQVGELAPDWFDARNSLGTLHLTLARIQAAEPHLRATVKLAATPAEEAVALNNLAALLQDTNRLAEAEPLMRRALAIDEQSYGAEHPNVANDLNNLATLLKVTNRLAEAEPLMRRCIAILGEFMRKTGHEHPHMQTDLKNYRGILRAMNLPNDEIAQRVNDATAIVRPLKPIAPEVERLLGPGKSVADVLAALDRQYKAEGKPTIYFLRSDQPIAPHLDQLLGRSKLDVPLNEPIVPHLEQLLGPAPSTREVFETLDRQYREQNKPEIWFLPLNKPIAPHLDELLGPVPVEPK